MNTSNNTILITGGSAGIGFEIAKLLSEKGNNVIITGRNEERLHQAASKLANVKTIVSDVSKAGDVEKLVIQIKQEFPQLNMVINNAGQAFVFDITAENAGGFEKAEAEMLTNYLSVIRLNEKLIPLLKTQQNAAIVNVSSITAYVPSGLATYSASKAALHSYTQALRFALEKDTSIKVFELVPPLVDTEFSAPIGGKTGISPTLVAEELITALETDNFEIRVGQTEDIYQLSLAAPAEAFRVMNQTRIQEVL